MLGDKIKKLRLSQGLNQTAFAKRLFVTPGAVSQWEKGITRPDMDRLMMIAKEFCVPLDYFSDEPEKDERSEKKLLKNQLMIEMADKQPRTPEARIVSGGMDHLPQEQREKILNVVRAMFPEQKEFFSREETGND